jgi:hypothetical protein
MRTNCNWRKMLRDAPSEQLEKNRVAHKMPSLTPAATYKESSCQAFFKLNRSSSRKSIPGLDPKRFTHPTNQVILHKSPDR